jgi:hypothetical protein
MEHATGKGERQRTGARINELTAAEDRDSIAGTPHHKYVPVRLIPIEAAQA